MQRMIEVKHVGPRGHVRQLLEELLGRLEHKLRHFPEDAVSMRVVFEENGSRTLSRASLTCHVPGHTIAAHEEQRDAGAAIRGVFAEVERQLEKQKARHLRERAASIPSVLRLASARSGLSRAKSRDESSESRDLR